VAAAAQAQPFQLPTANQALFDKGGEERFFVGTVGKPWTTGTFGCVRSGGWQMHEGLDIRCLQRDRHGEPTDPVLATADGTVAYIGTRPSLSNYGNYLVLLGFLRNQKVLCRVLVRKADFPWLKRYAALVRPNPRAEKEGVAGYEIALNFNGVAFELIPRAASEIKGKARFQLISVHEAECRKNPARRLVAKRGAHWELTSHGLNLLELLTY